MARPTAFYDAATASIKTMPSYLCGAVLFVFHLGEAHLAFRSGQLSVSDHAIVIGHLAVIAPITGITVPGPNGVRRRRRVPIGCVKTLGFDFVAGKPYQPLWPMLFVTIACGAISGWHALFGSVGTARQLEYETDALPVGGGAMFTENVLALLSLMAVSIVGAGGGGGRFAWGWASCYAATAACRRWCTAALGFGAFVTIVLTVTLVFRVIA
jgi:carbon starvation protein